MVSDDKKASSVSRRAIFSAAVPIIRNSFRTATCDNGREFALHEQFSKELSADWCFVRPCHSWQRGLSGNTSGLMRQYFPKGMDFGKLEWENAQKVMDRLNNRPKQCPGFETPDQVFFYADLPVAFQT